MFIERLEAHAARAADGFRQRAGTAQRQGQRFDGRRQPFGVVEGFARQEFPQQRGFHPRQPHRLPQMTGKRARTARQAKAARQFSRRSSPRARSRRGSA